MKLRRMSSSQKDVFDTCEAQWMFKYFLELPPDEKFNYAATLYGSAYHEILEYVFHPDNVKDLSYLVKNKEEIARIVRQMFRDKYESFIGNADHNNQEVKMSMMDKRNDNHITNYTYFVYIATQKLLAADWLLEYDDYIPEKSFEYNTGQFVVNGKVDLIGWKGNNFTLFDFKTGKHFDFAKIESSTQVMLYSYMAYKLFGKLPDDFKFIKFNIDLMRMTTRGLDGIEEEILERAEKELNKLYKKMSKRQKTGEFYKLDPTQKSAECVWCEYKKSCKDYFTYSR